MTQSTGPPTGRTPSIAERGMIATPHHLASQAGLHVLRRGGSAVDAAIAANTVLCVAYPHMAGIGGDAFALTKAPGQEVTAINASGPAARETHRDRYREAGHESIPSRGEGAVLTVPGAVDGWRLAHERYGRLEWADLFDDAIHYADRGVPVARSLARWYPQDAQMLAEQAAAREIFLPGGAMPQEGDRLRNADLAASLQLIARHGARAGFYEGELAERICSGLSASHLTPEDFSEYRATWTEPIYGDYRGHRVAQLPPNTQGLSTIQILKMLETFDISSWADPGAELIHHAAEATKLAFADRDAWVTDPDHQHIPLDQLLDSDYLADRAGHIKPDSSLPMGDIDSGVTGGWDGGNAIPEGDTVYLCATDETDLTVSLIELIYHDFGAGVVAPGTGILMQNRGSFFSLDPEHHNRLEPAKRTFHTLIPGMVLNPDGSVYAAIGSMGGEGQPQSQAAMLMRMVDYGYDVQQAIEAPRWLMGRTWGAESRDLWLEGRINDVITADLVRRGQPVALLTDWNDNVGHAQMIRHNRDGYFEGGADPRGDGAALGF